MTQSAYRTFFRRAEAGDFQFDEDSDIWKLLVTIALNNVRRTVRRLSAGFRDVRKETSSSADGMDHFANGPGFERALTVADVVSQLCDTLSKRHGELLSLRLQGHSQQEIAARLGVTDRTIRRMLEEVRTELKVTAEEE